MLPPYGTARFKPFKFSLSVDMQGFAYSSVLGEHGTGRPTFCLHLSLWTSGSSLLWFKQVKQNQHLDQPGFLRWRFICKLLPFCSWCDAKCFFLRSFYFLIYSLITLKHINFTLPALSILKPNSEGCVSPQYLCFCFGNLVCLTIFLFSFFLFSPTVIFFLMTHPCTSESSSTIDLI